MPCATADEDDRLFKLKRAYGLVEHDGNLPGDGMPNTFTATTRHH
jgi:hypothetical protein